jgi:microsomal dipeptidase-like Zn-dependent dipeptidase
MVSIGYIGDAEDKRKKHGERREEKEEEKTVYMIRGGARALVVALAPREDNTKTTKQTQAVTSTFYNLRAILNPSTKLSLYEVSIFVLY